MRRFTAAIMSVSCSDCLSDLLCGEDSGLIFSDDDEDCRFSPEESSSSADHGDGGDSIAGLIEDERYFVPGGDYLSRFDASARAQSVAWILKVHSFYGFQPLTAYLAVNYLDRFLYSRRLPQTDGWALQLLSVACLSLAAKMEERIVPYLLDFQVEGAKYVFEPRTIQRMELLVLNALDWRLRSVTPFSFIAFFACKLDPTGTSFGFLISRSTEIILSNIQEASFLQYWPSCIAVAAILSVANEIENPNFSMVNAEQAESWCEGLSKEKIIGCYGLIKEISVESGGRKMTSEIIPQLRVTIRTRKIRSSINSTTTNTTSVTESSSSSTTSSPCKRRKLNNSSWVDDDKGNSD